MTKTIFILLTFFCTHSVAQDTCNCLENLNIAIKKVSDNYAGFTDKVKPGNSQLYFNLVDSLQKAAPRNNIDIKCLTLLKKYTAFFHDGHLGISLLTKRNTIKSITVTQPVSDKDIPSLIFQNRDWVIITIPSFSVEYTDTIRKLFDRYQLKLSKTKNWIIDVRGNDGGSEGVYAPILPFIYTNPIIVEGGKEWCSKDNVKAAREEYEDYKNQVDSITKSGWLKNIERMEANVGKWKSGAGDTIVFNKIKYRPAKVAILIDKGCASSTEIFIMKAMQSKKVTLFGVNTNGTVDYGNVKYWDDMPYKPFNLRIATLRWNWIDKTGGIDLTGIKPDVTVPNGTKDWIKYTMQH